MTINSLTAISGIGPQTAKELFSNGFKTVQAVAEASIDALSDVQGFSNIRAEKTIQLAASLLNDTPAKQTKAKPTPKPAKEAKKDMAKKKKEKIKKLKKQLNKKKLKKKDKKKLKKKLKKLKK